MLACRLLQRKSDEKVITEFKKKDLGIGVIHKTSFQFVDYLQTTKSFPGDKKSVEFTEKLVQFSSFACIKDFQ